MTSWAGPRRVAMNNDTCEKSSMGPQAYKVIKTNANEISGWKILSRIIHVREPHLVGMNCDVQSDLATGHSRTDEVLAHE